MPHNTSATGRCTEHISVYVGLVGMRITKPCGGDDPFKIEGSMEQHELLLSDMSLAPPDSEGKCRRLYNRQGKQIAFAPSPCIPMDSHFALNAFECL